MSMTSIKFSDIDLLAFSVFLKKRGGNCSGSKCL